MEPILKIWYYQLLILFIIWLLSLVGKKKMMRFLPSKLLPIDVMTPFMLVGIHFLTLDESGNSIVPYVLLGMALWGILMTLNHVFIKGELGYRSFYWRYWRLADIVITIIYCCIVVLEILK
ncbi:DUF3397 domain-containing protein [Liquorilactobacillus sucicola]|uniref:DUF3397 domain-containing protein n=1 Tax=Liquorilactobacillus sucicola TaxID=519050 RepID=UPI000552C22C|nr:DUF3397 domain-containing protein [Liquorilactobacillus sucicola]